MKRVQVLCVFSLLAGGPLFGAAPLSGQAEDWLAWHGCWQAEGAPTGEYLCIVPDGAAGVRMATVAGGAVVAESRVITDGRARRVQTEGCSGTEVAIWSADYHRVFLNSELSCEGGVKRQASGVFAITSVANWVSVQAVTIDGRTATRTVSYAAVDDGVAPATIRPALRRAALDRVTARSTALLPVDAGDVDEAVGRIDAAAVQEWLIATSQPFQLADELAPAADDVVTRSALDHTGYFASDRPYTRDVVRVVERPVEVVHVIEQPVYVHTHVYEYRYRSCWDPFFSGVVIGLGHGVSIGVGHSHCGRRFLTHYSPWGYDLFGWRLVHVRPIIIAGRAVIHRRDTRRPPRFVSASPRPEPTADPRMPTRPRQDAPVRTAQPRGTSHVTRSPESRDPGTSPGSRTASRADDVTSTVLSSQVRSSSSPTRTAQPRTPGSGSMTRGTPTTSNAQPIRQTDPPRGSPTRAPTSTTRTRVESVYQPPQRSAEPRASIPTRQADPPASRGTTSARSAEPRPAPPPRGPTSSGVTSSPRTVDRPAASSTSSTPPSQGAPPPARAARPRGGEERN